MFAVVSCSYRSAALRNALRAEQFAAVRARVRVLAAWRAHEVSAWARRMGVPQNPEPNEAES